MAQVRSTIGASRRHKASVRGLGLRRVGQVVDCEDTPAVRGMVKRASHLVHVVDKFWDFSRLSTDQRRALHRGGSALAKVPMGFATPVCISNPALPADTPDNVNNGTGSLISIADRQFCVTAQHVVEKYRNRRLGNESVKLFVGQLRVDLDERLVGEDAQVDLAVLDMGGISARDIGVEGEIPTNFLAAKEWPPQLPEVGSFVMFGGYPGDRRSAKGRKIVWRSLSSGAAYVYEVSEQNIVCRIETDRRAAHRDGFKTQELGEIGGISGGPVIQERETPAGIVVLHLVGFVYEYQPAYDLLLIRPAKYISAEGTIRTN